MTHEDDSPDDHDAPIKIAMSTDDPGEKGYVRMVLYHPVPFTVSRPIDPVPLFYIMANGRYGEEGGCCIRITEPIARQLVADLTAAIEAPETFHVSHEKNQS